MNNQNNQVNIPSEYKPISMWGYFGYQILFAIPIIGFILFSIFCKLFNKKVMYRYLILTFSI